MQRVWWRGLVTRGDQTLTRQSGQRYLPSAELREGPCLHVAPPAVTPYIQPNAPPPEPRALSQVRRSPSCTRILEVTFCHVGQWDKLRRDRSFCRPASAKLKTQLQCPNVGDTTRQRQQSAMKRSDCPSSCDLTDGRGGRGGRQGSS